LDAEHIQGGELYRDDALVFASVEDGVPDVHGVVELTEDLVATFAGVACAGNQDRVSEELSIHVMEILKITQTWNMLFQVIHGGRAQIGRAAWRQRAAME